MDIREQLQRTLGTAYVLERELGGGGMSRVFVAEETALGRKVVVKVLPPGRTGDVDVERFKREIQVAAKLQHAHIVPVLAAGDTDGLPFYTMPFVEGESLRSRLTANGPIPIGDCINILRDVSRALAYAHEHGVVHRDVKPDNVLTAGSSSVVTDFGIAKAISASRTDTFAPTLTQAGTSLGTPAYMAPEQAAGDPNTDFRADLYAFGCMAYEMLAGTPPFVAPTAQQLVAAHLTRAPEAISARRPELPPTLASLVMQCLEKDAALRPASAAEITRSLDTVTSGVAHEAIPYKPHARAAVLRRALAIYGVAFLVVVLAAKVAEDAIGLPDWVFPTSLLIMAVLLPLILFTAYVQQVKVRAASSTPTFTPGGTPSPGVQGTLATMAMKASPHVSWRRTTLGAVYATGAFVLLVITFMVLRALGVGPFGSLLAAGTLDAKEPLLVTDFAVSNADTALGRVLSDATKTTLAQSQVITLLPPEAVAAALARMEAPPTTALDLRLARALAGRNGIKAIVDGNITGIPGGGFIVTLRLVTADSVKELASVRETAGDARGLIAVIDKLSRRLRGRIGESLRTVHTAPSLAQVTTSSFDALRKYTEGDRAEAFEGNRPRAIQLLREAVTIDSTFAEAWRRLGVILTNGRHPRAQIDSAFAAAYRHRSHTSERERTFIEATYLSSPGAGRDRAKGIAAYEELLRQGDTIRAANNLAVLVDSRRQFARAETLYRAALRVHGVGGRLVYNNLVTPLVVQEKFAAAESVITAGLQEYPDFTTLKRQRIAIVYLRGDIAGYRRALDSVKAKGDSADRAWLRLRMMDLAALEGRIADYTRQAHEQPLPPGNVRARVLRSIDYVSALRGLLLGEGDAVVRELDAAVAGLSPAVWPESEWPLLAFASIYARVGQPEHARRWLARYDAVIKDTVRLRLDMPARENTLGTILLAENRPLESIIEYRKGDVLPDGPSNSCVVCLPAALGDAFDRAGMTDSAIVYLELSVSRVFEDALVSGYAPLVVPRNHKRLGELYESKGDRIKAAEHYRKFIELWKNADPALQPQVDDARRRLRGLTDIEAVSSK